jgi:hypothetical protein
MKKGIKIITRKNIGVDFGPGFYVTVGDEQQAWDLAHRRAKRPIIPSGQVLEMLEMTIRDFLAIKQTLKPAIIKYKINDVDNWLKLKHKVYLEDSREWQKHVWVWRQNTSPPGTFSWVFGPVADGGLGSSFFENIRAYPNMNQLAIHNEEAIRMLDFWR